MSEQEVQVSYSLKEVLERLEGKIDDLSTKLDREFTHLEARVASLETWRNRMAGALALLTAMVIPLGVVVLAHYLP